MTKTTKILISGQWFDSECPKYCPGKRKRFKDGDLCMRCPIYIYKGKDPWLNLEDYNPELAKTWREWFDGIKNRPILNLFEFLFG